MNPEDLFHQRRLSGIVRQLGGIVQNLAEFAQENPHVIAPNVIAAMIGNLKDDMNILLREVNILGSSDRQALKDRRYICRSCQGIFMAPMVAGICDECRGRGITTADLSHTSSSDDGEQQTDSEPQGTSPPDDALPTLSERDSDDPFAEGQA